MREIGNGIYEVESDSDADRIYTVNVGATVPTCTCTAFAINRNRQKRDTGSVVGATCKHIKSVQQSYNAQQQQEIADTEAQLAAIRLRHLYENLARGGTE